uniref:Nucleolar protein 10 n=1 Tax=Panagrellus redivivus TaxID=6233 RepID=A0A7E4VEQ6_PANRE
MEVSATDDFRVYNLSKGDSIPDWVSSKRRRKLEKQYSTFHSGIRLVQDFGFPDLSTAIALTPDGQYILGSGVYKPSLKLFDVNELSQKYEHGLDADAIDILPISDDYRKMIVLEVDRYCEIFSNGYRYYRFRFPRYNRAMVFSEESSDLIVVGAGPHVYRFNLEAGQFLQPMESSVPSFNCCALSKHHQLLLTGSTDGRIEAFDHRDRNSVGLLDCALSTITDYDHVFARSTPQITSVAFKDALHFAAGTSTGHVLLYDLRSSKPLLVKDHNMGLPITHLDFQKDEEVVMSMDSRMLKFWDESTGKPIGAIEPGVPLTKFIRYPDSGLFFFAAEAPEMLQYFVPNIGPAPKWCYHLESIVDELDNVDAPQVYDDYKFVTKDILEEIGLEHLIGTNLLRAHMHGYFIDVRLFNRAKTLTQPQAIRDHRRNKLREDLDKQATTLHKAKDHNAVRVKVNKELATQLKQATDLKSGSKKNKDRASIAGKLLTDDRFSSLFENPDFSVDTGSEAYKQLSQRLGAEQLKKSGNKKEVVSSDENEDDEMEQGPQSGLFMPDDAHDSDADSEVEVSNDDDGSAEDDSESDSDESSEDGDDVDMEDEEDAAPGKAEINVHKPRGFKFLPVGSLREVNAIKTGEQGVDEGLTETFGARKKELKKKNDGFDVEDTGTFGGRSISFVPKE